MKSLHELFIDGIKDIYNAEKQLTKALPKMAKMAQNPRLKEGFQNHLRQTEEHVRRVEQACQSLGEKPTGMVCRGMMGLVEEASEHMKELKPSAAGDAELIALAQKVEHYEIGTYGTLCTWAEMMGHDQALQLFKQTLNEEEETDELLTQIAEGEVNQQAAQEHQQMQMEEQQGGGATRGRSRRSGGGRGRSSTGGRGRGRSTGTTARGRSAGTTRGRASTGRGSTSGRGGGRSSGTTSRGSTRGRSTSGRSSSESHSRGGGSSRGGASRGGGRGRKASAR